jgi:stress response protein SCP2
MELMHLEKEMKKGMSLEKQKTSGSLVNLLVTLNWAAKKDLDLSIAFKRNGENQVRKFELCDENDVLFFNNKKTKNGFAVLTEDNRNGIDVDTEDTLKKLGVKEYQKITQKFDEAFLINLKQLEATHDAFYIVVTNYDGTPFSSLSNPNEKPTIIVSFYDADQAIHINNNSEWVFSTQIMPDASGFVVAKLFLNDQKEWVAQSMAESIKDNDGSGKMTIADAIIEIINKKI